VTSIGLGNASMKHFMFFILFQTRVILHSWLYIRKSMFVVVVRLGQSTMKPFNLQNALSPALTGQMQKNDTGEYCSPVLPLHISLSSVWPDRKSIYFCTLQCI